MTIPQNYYFDGEKGKFVCRFCGHEQIGGDRPLYLNKKCPNCRTKIGPFLNGRPPWRGEIAYAEEQEVAFGSVA